MISSRVPSIKESTFRRPLIPQTYNKIGTADAFKTQLDVNYYIKFSSVKVMCAHVCTRELSYIKYFCLESYTELKRIIE